MTIPTQTNPAAFQQLNYQRTETGLIKSITDKTEQRPGVPRFGAAYTYDRLYQLTGANTEDGGAISYAYDTIQNLVRRTTNAQINNLLNGEFKYGENAGPNQMTSAISPTGEKKTFEYNVLGQMKQYNGFDLTFDVEGRLVEASKPSGNDDHQYHYDDTGEKKLTIIHKPGENDKIYRYISGGYQIRNGEEVWFVSGGQGQAEITKSQGLGSGS